MNKPCLFVKVSHQPTHPPTNTPTHQHITYNFMSIRVMKYRQISAYLFLASRSTSTTSCTAFSTASSTSRSLHRASRPLINTPTHRSMTTTTSSTSDNNTATPEIRHIGKAEMQQILTEHEEMLAADLESPYFVLDVRTEPEVQQTGKLSPSVPTLPVQVMMPPYNALQMDDEDFEEAFGFRKPPKDVTMVFSCAAGIRSVSACQLAFQAGYKDCVNYTGGAHEWFGR